MSLRGSTIAWQCCRKSINYRSQGATYTISLHRSNTVTIFRQRRLLSFAVKQRCGEMLTYVSLVYRTISSLLWIQVVFLKHDIFPFYVNEAVLKEIFIKDRCNTLKHNTRRCRPVVEAPVNVEMKYYCSLRARELAMWFQVQLEITCACFNKNVTMSTGCVPWGRTSIAGSLLSHKHAQ